MQDMRPKDFRRSSCRQSFERPWVSGVCKLRCWAVCTATHAGDLWRERVVAGHMRWVQGIRRFQGWNRYLQSSRLLPMRRMCTWFSDIPMGE